MELLDGIAHVGLVVKDLQRTLDSLERLGMKCVRREVVHRGADVEVAFLQVGKQAVELIQPLAGSTSQFTEWLAKRGEGVHHLALSVADIEQTVAELARRGMAVPDAKPNLTSAGSRSLWLTPDPLDGVRIQLVDGGNPEVRHPTGRA